ncbi:MAG: twin-arginine translocase TatA/TatE family subunit [Pseudomonadota bacterium]
MFGLGIPEIIIIAIILLLIFGGKRLPEIGKNLGKTVRELRKVKEEISEEKSTAKPTQEDKQRGPEGTKSIQETLAKKVIEQIPVARDAKNLKDKADKIKDIIN